MGPTPDRRKAERVGDTPQRCCPGGRASELPWPLRPLPVLGHRAHKVHEELRHHDVDRDRGVSRRELLVHADARRALAETAGAQPQEARARARRRRVLQTDRARVHGAARIHHAASLGGGRNLHGDPRVVRAARGVDVLIHEVTVADPEFLKQSPDARRVVAELHTSPEDAAAVLDHIRKGRGDEIGLGATTVILEGENKGLTFVGPLPPEIQNYTTYAATVVAAGSASEAAREFVRYLTAPVAQKVFAAAGIQ